MFDTTCRSADTEYLISGKSSIYTIIKMNSDCDIFLSKMYKYLQGCLFLLGYIYMYIFQ